MSGLRDWVLPLLVAIIGPTGIAGLIKLYQNRRKSKGGDTVIADASDKTVRTMVRAMEQLEKQKDVAEARADAADKALHEFQVRYAEVVESDLRVQRELADLKRTVAALRAALAETEEKLSEARAQLARYQRNQTAIDKEKDHG